MQIVAVGIEPYLGALDIAADAGNHAPEPRRVVHLDEMRDFVGREIVQHIGRRQNETPRERQRARSCARAPAARLIADRDPLHLLAQRLRIMLRSLLKITTSFAFQEVMDPAVDMFGSAGDADDALAALSDLSPHHAPHARAMYDTMRNAAQRYYSARLKRRGLRQPTETRCDPGTMTLRKVLGVRQRAAGRHGQDCLPIARMNAQGIAARAPMPA